MIILVVLAILLAILAPVLARLIQMAMSRQREYLADASGVALTRNPEGLASALAKISADPEVLEVANRATGYTLNFGPPRRPNTDTLPGRSSPRDASRAATARCRDSSSVRSSAGVTRSRNGWGMKPIQKIRIRSGANTSRSRSVRSARPSFSWCVTGPKITRWYIHSM